MTDRRKQSDRRRYRLTVDTIEGCSQSPTDRRLWGNGKRVNRRSKEDWTAAQARQEVELREKGICFVRKGLDRRQS